LIGDTAAESRPDIRQPNAASKSGSLESGRGLAIGGILIQITNDERGAMAVLKFDVGKHFAKL
jgi:hypothetical protein